MNFFNGLFGRGERNASSISTELRHTRRQIQLSDALKRQESLRVIENNTAALENLSTDPETTTKLVAGLIAAAAEYPGVYGGNIWHLMSFVKNVMGVPNSIRLITRDRSQENEN